MCTLMKEECIHLWITVSSNRSTLVCHSMGFVMSRMHGLVGAENKINKTDLESET